MIQKGTAESNRDWNRRRVEQYSELPEQLNCYQTCEKRTENFEVDKGVCDAGATAHQFSTCRERGLRREVRESAKSLVVKPGASLLLEYLHSGPLDVGPNVVVSRVFSDV